MPGTAPKSSGMRPAVMCLFPRCPPHRSATAFEPAATSSGLSGRGLPVTGSTISSRSSASASPASWPRWYSRLKRSPRSATERDQLGLVADRRAERLRDMRDRRGHDGQARGHDVVLERRLRTRAGSCSAPRRPRGVSSRPQRARMRLRRRRRWVQLRNHRQRGHAGRRQSPRVGSASFRPLPWSGGRLRCLAF